MKPILSVFALLLMAQSLTACIVEPIGGYHDHERGGYHDDRGGYAGGWCGERRHCH